MRSVRAIVAIALLAAATPAVAQTCPPAEFGTAGFWVSSYGTDEVFRFDAHGTFLDSFSHTNLDGPRSLTVNATGEIYAASQLSDEIHVFDAAGTLLRSFSSPGLNGPTGAAMSPTGDYYVCSFDTDEVIRFSASETVVDTYTSTGLNGPNCIVFLPSGEFLVTGQFSNDVHRFDADGNSLGNFPTGQSSVMGAALDLEGRVLIAAGASNDIGVFDCSGVELDMWSVPGGPQSIAIREDGAIFVTTFFSDEVLQLSSDGVVDSSWNGGNQLRGIEFLPAPLPMFERGDMNRDGTVDVSDAIGALSYLFTAGEAACHDAMDINDDGGLDIADPIGLLGYLFQAGAPPAAPFGSVGSDPTPDTLWCLDD